MRMRMVRAASIGGEVGMGQIRRAQKIIVVMPGSAESLLHPERTHGSGVERINSPCMMGDSAIAPFMSSANRVACKRLSFPI